MVNRKTKKIWTGTALNHGESIIRSENKRAICNQKLFFGTGINYLEVVNW